MCTGAGVSPTDVDYVLGICKAYATRVGGGPFPTELFDNVGAGLAERGHEFGATTGRPRRCGWLDTVALRRAVQLNGITGLCITKLDVMDGMETVKLANAYEYRGETLEAPPQDVFGYAECEPVYEQFPGWTQSTRNIRSFDLLPENAQRYLNRVQELAGCPVHLVSTGPDRNENIILRHPFA